MGKKIRRKSNTSEKKTVGEAKSPRTNFTVEKKKKEKRKRKKKRRRNEMK